MSGDGSIYKRTRTSPNGREYTRWVAQASYGGRDERKVVRRVCRTRGEAREALKELMGPARSAQPLGAFLRSWLDETARPAVAANTLRGYRSVIAAWEPIASIPLDELRADDIEAVLNRMTARRHGQRAETVRSASPKTRRNALAMLRHALESAHRRGHVARNEAMLVDMPRVPRQQREAITPERARAILAAVKGDRYEAAYALGMCGLRLGEVLGLAWADLDLDAGVANVRWQLIGSGKRAHRAQLKTAGSEALLPLPPFVVSRLVEHRKTQLAERLAAGQPTEEGLVFVTSRGYAVNGSWLTGHFQALLATAGLPRIRFHDLRHSTATLLADAGVHPSIAQRYMRHTQVTTTLGTYTHVARGREREAADVLERMVGG